MGPKHTDDQYDDVKRCLASADDAFARAGAMDDDAERLQLIEEAETWLTMAERRLARITGRPINEFRTPNVASESRSFRAERAAPEPPLWRRMPRA